MWPTKLCQLGADMITIRKCIYKINFQTPQQTCKDLISQGESNATEEKSRKIVWEKRRAAILNFCFHFFSYYLQTRYRARVIHNKKKEKILLFDTFIACWCSCVCGGEFCLHYDSVSCDSKKRVARQSKQTVYWWWKGKDWALCLVIVTITHEWTLFSVVMFLFLRIYSLA